MWKEAIATYLLLRLRMTTEISERIAGPNAETQTCNLSNME
jgi:hypothetical protein